MPRVDQAFGWVDKDGSAIGSSTKGPTLRKHRQQGQRLSQASLCRRLSPFAILMMAFLMTLPLASALVKRELFGLTCREVELQQEKKGKCADEALGAIKYASFGGGTVVQINGIGIHETVNQNQVWVLSKDLDGVNIPLPAFSENDEFQSNPVAGSLVLTMPKLTQILGLPEEALYKYESMLFEIYIVLNDGEREEIRCKTPSNCEIYFRRDMTPIIHMLNPPVMHYMSHTQSQLDVKGALTTIGSEELREDDRHFVTIRCGDYLQDAEEFTAFDDSYRHYFRHNHILWQTGQQNLTSSMDCNILFHTGNSQMNTIETDNCDTSGLNCYKAKYVAMIDAVSADHGYWTGNQVIKVSGHGFSETSQIKASVDDTPCTVINSTETEFYCRTGKNETHTNTTAVKDFKGSHGMKTTFINTTGTNDLAWFDDFQMNKTGWVNMTNLTLTTKTRSAYDDKYFQQHRFWYLANVTGEHCFHMSCDDHCRFYFSQLPNNKTNATKVFDIHAWTSEGNIWKSDGQNRRNNSCFNLTRGDYHYAELQHYEHSWSDHMSLGVRINNTEISSHKNAQKQVQKMMITAGDTHDVVQIVIEGDLTSDTNGQVKVTFVPQAGGTALVTTFSTTASANQIRLAVQSFYINNYGSHIDVTLTMYDTNGNVTTSASNSTKRVIDIKCHKFLETSAHRVTPRIAKVGTVATSVSIAQISTSSKPLSGTMEYRIVCSRTGYDQKISTRIRWNWSEAAIQNAIYNGCSSMFQNLYEVRETYELPYYQNGRAFTVNFKGINEDLPLLTFDTSSNNTLNSTMTAAGATPTFNTTIMQNYSANTILYDPIPFELIKTYEEEPQMIVSIGEHPAVCHGLKCGFKFIQPEYNISAYTYTSSNNSVYFVGNLTSDISLFKNVEFARSKCIIDNATMTNETFTCTLERSPTCGIYLPKINMVKGDALLLPNTTANDTTQIDCTVSAVSPNTELNQNGDDILELTGTNFPHSDDTTSVISVSFADNITTCEIQPNSQTNTTFRCQTKTSFFSTTAVTKSFNVTINNVTATNTNSLVFRATNIGAVSFSPSTASPVLKQQLVLKMNDSFPEVVNHTDFTVTLYNVSNPAYKRYLKPVSSNATSKEVTVMFGGAWSGMYKTLLWHKTLGALKTFDPDVTLEVGSNITSISTQMMSTQGGTIVTIQGTNFGTQKTDNPVSAVFKQGVKSVSCFVLTTNSTTITCQMDTSQVREHGLQGQLVVFLKTSEEAKCQTDCNITFSNNSGVVTNVSVSYNNESMAYQVEFNGTDFPTNGSDPVLKIGGLPQLFSSRNSTNVIFQVNNSVNSNLTNFEIIFDTGAPHWGLNRANFTYQMTPELASVYPLAGHPTGTKLYAKIPGVGVNSTGNYTITTATGDDLCEYSYWTGYSEFVCFSKNATFASSILNVKNITSGVAKQCSSVQNQHCTFEQSTNISLPTVSSVALSTNNTQMTFTGSGFTGMTANVSFLNVQSDLLTVNSDTEFVAQWNSSIPITSTASLPSLLYYSSNSSGFVFAYNLTVPTAFTNAVSVTASTADITCSYAGGCVYGVTGNVLYNLQNQSSNSYISICEQKCEILNTSSPTYTQCKLPAISTVYSDTNFKIQTEHLLTPTVTGTPNDQAQLAFDGDTSTIVEPNRATCEIEMTMKPNYIGIVTGVNYYLARNILQSHYNGVLYFEFYNETSAAWQTVFTANNQVTTGWNKHSFSNSTEYVQANKFRFRGTQKSACRINEIHLLGTEVINNTVSTQPCTPKLFINGAEETGVSLNQVSYQGSIDGNSKTPLLKSISPRFGTVVGGENITFNGDSFGTDLAAVSIYIDGINCVAQEINNTQINCTTGSRPGLVKSSLMMNITGKGQVSTQGKIFKYVNKWSDDHTWGGEYAPMAGESLYIPEGLNLLVDIDKSEQLNAVIVEGDLIFAPDVTNSSHHRYFDAHYIFVHKGSMEVGTPEFPYTSKLTITMHGNVTSPYIPIYGNKMTGIRNASLSMHGIERFPTWTMMDTTAEAGATTITLWQEVDWVAGEYISIASTSFESREAEKHQILSIDKSNATKPVITLKRPLEYKHFAKTEVYNGTEISMRAEVGLLTRNVVYRGDPETSKATQYGATIFLHSEGDNSLQATIANIEFTDMGQAFKIGRYAIHFHMIGKVDKSYIKGNAIHSSYNRAVTIHGTDQLVIENNVIFNAMGHNIFIEDAVETDNIIKGNLITMTKRSWSLLNTDQTPAAIWLTNPNNNIYDNHAAGSDRYSYWYDLQITAIGPSANPAIKRCPENEKVGIFRNNTAHSNGRYGLRIFHNMNPRLNPCEKIVYDGDYLAKNKTDPFWQNPLYTAKFENLTSWKNKRNGAIAEKISDVRFIDFKVADNLEVGIEYSVIEGSADGLTSIQDSIVIGQTNNSELLLARRATHGIVTARSENLTISNIRFFNYNNSDTVNSTESAPLGTCSHCWHDQATDSGARQIKTEKLQFFNCSVFVKFKTPFTGIFYDQDGSLTQFDPPIPHSWVTGDAQNGVAMPHLDVPECQTSHKHNGTICNNSTQLRRIAFHAATPDKLFEGRPMYFALYEDTIVNAKKANTTVSNPNKNWTNQLDEFYWDRKNYTVIQWKLKQDPWKAWTFAVATGHKYKFHFDHTGSDFEGLRIEQSEHWKPTDKPIVLVHNHTDQRHAINVQFLSDLSNNLTNGTIPDTYDLQTPGGGALETGQFKLQNSTDLRMFHLVLTGKNNRGIANNRTLQLHSERCLSGCQEAIEVNVTEEVTVRYWSNPNHWPNNTKPKDGEDVHIEPGWTMVMDLNDTDKEVFNMIRVNGKLIFSNEKDTVLRAKHIFIRAGELWIGNSTEHPYNHTAKIILSGEKESEAIVYDNAIEAGNKLIANVGKMNMFGKKRKITVFRLHQEAFKDDKIFYVEKDLDLVAGDKLGIAPTSFDNNGHDFGLIKSYDNKTGKVEFHDPLEHYHYGDPQDQSSRFDGKFDIRAEVMLLSRNIQLMGEDIQSWGGQIVTSDMFDDSLLDFRYGQTIMDNVEIYNCSQINTEKAAIRFEKSGSGTLKSSITNSAIHNGYAWGVKIHESAKVDFIDNIVFKFRAFGVAITDSNTINFKSNIVSGIYERPPEKVLHFIEMAGGVSICGINWKAQKCHDIIVTNNIVAGAPWAGFTIWAHQCSETGSVHNTYFYDNVAHSIGFDQKIGGSGAIIFPKVTDPTQTGGDMCYQASRFSAYKCLQTGAITYFNAKRVIFSDMHMWDNINGAGPMLTNKENQYDPLFTEFRDSTFYGDDIIPDCPQNQGRGQTYCIQENRFAVLPGFSSVGGKSEPHLTATSPMPFQNIMSIASFGNRAKWDNLVFKNFKHKLVKNKGSKLTVFGSNIFNPDFIPFTMINKPKFINVERGAMAFFMMPMEKWAIIKDCGFFPCTGPLNLLYTVVGATFEGPMKPAMSDLTTQFQLIANNEGLARSLKCTHMKQQLNQDTDYDGQSYFCDEPNMGLLLFESMDPDQLDRSVQPVEILQEGNPQFNNTLNSFMDHVWDGFYTGQTRQSTFPGVIDATKGKVYNIKYTGTPPKKQRFELQAHAATPAARANMGILVRIAYPDSRSYTIKQETFANGVWSETSIFENDIEQTTNEPAVVSQTKCGEYRYLAVRNILEFYLTPGCRLKLLPKDAIKVKVRMEWSLTEFFSNGGTTAFADRIAGSLGIHASEIKVVSVYEGSLVVDYNIYPSETASEEEAATQLAAVEAKQTQLLSTGSMDLGAPVLDVQSGNVAIVSDGVLVAPGYTRTVITKTASNQVSYQLIDIQQEEEEENLFTEEEGQQQRVFEPDVDIVIIDGQTKHVNPHPVAEEEQEQEKEVEEEVDEDEPPLSPELPPQIVKKGTSPIMILIVLGFAFSLIMLMARTIYKYLQGHHTEDEEERRKAVKKQKDFELSVVSEVKFHPDMSNRETISAINTDKKLRESLGLYEEQYDPSSDFSIFVPQMSRQSDRKGKGCSSQIDSFSYHGSENTIMKGHGHATSDGSGSGSNSPDQMIRGDHIRQKSNFAMPEDREIEDEDEE